MHVKSVVKCAEDVGFRSLIDPEMTEKPLTETARTVEIAAPSGNSAAFVRSVIPEASRYEGNLVATLRRIGRVGIVPCAQCARRSDDGKCRKGFLCGLKGRIRALPLAAGMRTALSLVDGDTNIKDAANPKIVARSGMEASADRNTLTGM